MQMRYLHWLTTTSYILSSCTQKVILATDIGTIDLRSELLGVKSNQMGVGTNYSPICLSICYLLSCISCYVALHSRNTGYTIETLYLTVGTKSGCLLLNVQLVLLLGSLNI